MSISVARPAVLGMQNVTHSYGAQPILDGVSVSVHEGDRVGLIGRNGSGKSTIMRILAGIDPPDSGTVTRMQGLRVSLLGQQDYLPRERTVGQVLDAACGPLRRMLVEFEKAAERLAVLPADAADRAVLESRSAEIHEALDHAGAWHLDLELKRVSVALRLPERDRVIGTLSGGEVRRVDLATKLLEHPDVLLLDEPTNHVDTASVEWLERFLGGFIGSCVLVTHDRYFLDRIVTRIVELEFGKVYSFPGRYTEFLEYKAGIDDNRARTEENRRAFLRRELEWIKRGPQARTTKQKARISRFDSAETQGPPPRHREFVFEIPEPARLSKSILTAKNVGHGYGDTPLFKDLDLIMQQGMRVGILGENGCGKTTLLRVLMGQEKPRKGQVIVGDTTQFLYVDQSLEDVVPEQTVLEFVSDGQRYWEVGPKTIYVPAYLEKFLFDKESVHVPVGTLSGGEQHRLALLRKLLRGGNFVVFDEPTNDLDLYTLRVLEEAILSFDGCALIVSHDRYFLNRVCTHLLVFEGNGVITTITGDYDDYLLYRERKAEDQAAVRERAARTPATPTAPEGPKRLTYVEKRELEGMEAAILAAEDEVKRLEEALLAPGFYEQPHERVREALAGLESAKAGVERLYKRWEELEARA